MTNLRGVTESLVGDEENPGRVRIQGESWKAVTEGEPIPTGAPITVRKAYGTTLWVEKQTL
jgi:membrane-bound ClpP family serine protease